jgi:hypothetical protein
VRKLGEFLREVDRGGHVTLPDVRFDQNGQQVRTPGLGFLYAQDVEPSVGAERLGQSNQQLLAELGLDQVVVG